MRAGITAFLLMLLACAPAHADDWNLFSPCADAGFSELDRQDLQETGRCNPLQLARMHQAFAAPPIAEIAGGGGQAVRVTVTDGMGGLLIVAEAVRRAGASSARVTARGRGGRTTPHMEAELERDAWEAIARRTLEQAHASAFTPPPAPRDPAAPPADDGDTPICFHGWGVTIETFGFGRSRVMERNACDDRND